MQSPAPPPGTHKPEQALTRPQSAWRTSRASLLEQETSMPVVATAAGLVTPRPRFAWARPATLLLGSAIVLAADLAAAITPGISAALTALETLFVPVWLAAFIMTNRAAKKADARSERPAAHLATLVILLVLVIACIVEKWVLLAFSESSPGIIAQYRSYTVLAFVLTNASLLGRRPFERLLATATEHPARLMILSFGIAALLGAFLLTLPQALHRIEDASFVNGLFMATSAVCVTGLAVHNVAEVYTPFGQAVLLVLIQVGGLGIMVLSTFFAILAGRQLRLRDARVMAEMIDTESFSNLRKSLKSIVTYTLVLEGLGIVALLAAFEQYPQVSAPFTPDAPMSGAGSLVWAALFHSISAFCNAGFSLFRDGMVPFVGSVPVNVIIMALIIIGGLGFPVHDEIARWTLSHARGIRPSRLSLHTRVVLWTTLALVIAGTMGFLVLEFRRSMQHLSWPNRFLAALFQSVMTRTAGFNSVDFGAMSHATWLFTCILMFIGAAPASTGGGVKVTTLAVLFATLRAELQGFEAPRLLGRTVPAMVVRRAMGVAFMSVLIVVTLLFIVFITEPLNPLALAFETVSAFATVGLSTGITPSLNVPGRLAITAAMFIGRIGPLTLALALANKSSSRAYRLPEERIGIG